MRDGNGVRYRIEEVTARCSAEKVEPLTELDVRDGLRGLPVSVPVAVEDLTKRERARLRLSRQVLGSALVPPAAPSDASW